MTYSRRDLAFLAAAVLAPKLARAEGRGGLIIADQGAVTRAAFDLAIDQGADMVAAGVVASQDGALLAAPDILIDPFTDVAARAEFAARKATRTIDGAPMTGWFVEDFTLAELKTLAVGAVLPRARRGGGPPPAPPTLLTFQDLVAIVRAGCVRQARTIGLYARLVRPGHFASIDLALEGRVADEIRAGGYNSPAAAMMVEAAEAASLRDLHGLTRARRVLRVATLPEDLAGVRSDAEALAADDGLAAAPQAAAAHAAGLAFYAREPAPVRGRSAQAGLEALIAAGVDGVLTADPALAQRARAAAMRRR